ncbi:MAG: F0F1 ATP synthase subunit B/delta [Actinobacteria bacterium]|nr:F0F1 ATP synthase subunit B/delta [Actinomycetota bacterium]
MGTFLAQLVGFAVIIFIIVKYAVPPIRKLMKERQETVRLQLEESAKAAQRLADADRFHAQRVAEGRTEAQNIVEEAASDAVRIAEQLRVQGGVESERIKVYGTQQMQLLRAQLIRELRSELGNEAVERATEIVKARVADPSEQSATVDRFIDELEAMSSISVSVDVTPTDLRPASRDARALLVAQFDRLASALAVADLSLIAEEMTAVATLLQREPLLARHLTEAGGDPAAKKAMLERLLGGKVSAHSMALLATAVEARWSASQDVIASIQYIARLGLLARAEREGEADAVAEQLFRFGRVLDSEPRLVALLGDFQSPASGRVELVRSVAGGSVLPTTSDLLAQTVELLHGERADDAVRELAQLAVSRRGEIVAQVSAAAPLIEAQRTRLTAVLARIYRNPVSIDLTVEPRLLGGLSVAVGDEVIDGTLSSRLAAAATRLPD